MKIVIVSADDWSGLYINDHLETEGHSISNSELAEAIIKRFPRQAFEYTEVEADSSWLENLGNFPKELKKVKLRNG